MKIHGLRLWMVSLLAYSAQAAATDPSSFSMGMFEVTPELTVDSRYNDNIFSSFEDEDDDFIIEVIPKISAVAEKGANSWSIDLSLTDATYEDSDPDEYTDWTVDTDVHLEANSRNAFDLFAGYHFLHENRGTGFSQGELVFLIDRPDTYEEVVYGGAYTFGGEDSKGRIKLGADVYEKEYDRFDNPNLTRDRDNTNLTGAFYWGLSDKTDFVFEGRYTDIDYDEAPLDTNPGLDSEEVAFLAGVEWEATGKTTGKVLVGVVDKDFDDNARDDWEWEFTWDAEVLYQANDFHLFTFGAANVVSEAVGTSDFINTDEYTASWNWDVNDITRVNAFFRYATDEYEGDVRDDDLILFEVGIERDIRRWFTVSASYTYDERDSNIFTLDYERNVFLVGLDFSL